MPPSILTARTFLLFVFSICVVTIICATVSVHRILNEHSGLASNSIIKNTTKVEITLSHNWNGTTSVNITENNNEDEEIGEGKTTKDTSNDVNVEDIGEIDEVDENESDDNGKSDENTKAEFVLNTEHDFKKKIITQGRAARVGYFKPFDPEKYSQPTIEEVEVLYGDRIVIHGLDQCKAYRDKVSGRLRYIAPAGLQNTGTNTLYKLLQRNCYIPEHWVENPRSNRSETPFTPDMDELFDCQKDECKKKLDSFDLTTGIRETVAWWKHGPASWRDNPPYLIQGIAESKEGKRFDRMNALPVVMIKDPVNWMSSMCRNPYEVSFYRPMGRCPKLTQPEKRTVTIIPPKGLKNKYIIKYDTLIDMWGYYYNEWTNNASFPNLVVRYEDLLFHPKEVISQVCACAGGKMRDDGFRLMEKSSKPHGFGILGPKTSRTGLSAATIIYGKKDIRDSVLDHDDKRFARKNLNPNVMNTFNYKPP